jgi:hypothetical protein
MVPYADTDTRADWAGSDDVYEGGGRLPGIWRLFTPVTCTGLEVIVARSPRDFKALLSRAQSSIAEGTVQSPRCRIIARGGGRVQVEIMLKGARRRRDGR